VSGSAGVVAWLVGDLSSAVVAEFFDLLDAEERRRVAGFSTVEARRRFVIAHGATRRIVGEHLGAPPEALAWRTGPQGKPELTGDWTGVQTNLSHSGGRCLIALSATRAVGADIQHCVPGLDVLAMARRYFPPVEAQAVADDPAVFGQLWARKEAITKAAGGRLTQVLPLLTPPDVVEVTVSRYRVVDIDAPEGFQAAIALAGPAPFAVELNEWSP
jgi:4'-phosphopantetheinyl transferase